MFGVERPTYEASPWDEATAQLHCSRAILDELLGQGCTPLGFIRMKTSQSALWMALLRTPDGEAFVDTSNADPRRSGVAYVSVLTDGTVISTERIPRLRGADAAREKLDTMTPAEAKVEGMLLDESARAVQAGVLAMVSDSFRLELVRGAAELDDVWAHHRTRLAEHRAGGGAGPAVHDRIELSLALKRAVAVQRTRRIGFTVSFANFTFVASFLPGILLGVRACLSSGARTGLGLVLAVAVGLGLPFWWAGRVSRVAVAVYRRLHGGVAVDLRDAVREWGASPVAAPRP